MVPTGVEGCGVPYKCEHFAALTASPFQQTKKSFTKAAMEYRSKHCQLHAQTYLVSEVEKEPYAFLRVVHEVHLAGAHFDEAVDERKVAAHARLPGESNKNVPAVRDIKLPWSRYV